MIYFKKFLSILKEIELEFDINSLTYNNTLVWPVIRLELANLLIHNEKKNGPKINSIKGLEEKHKKNSLEFDALKASLTNYQNKDILFYTNDYLDSPIPIQGKYYNKFSDSFYTLFHEEYKISFMSTNNRYSNRYNENKKCDLSFLSEVVRIESLLAFYEKRYTITNLQEFIDYLLTKSIELDYHYIHYTITIMLEYTKYHKELFTILTPKSVCLTCFYSTYNMGLINAASQLNIPTIEIQHGIHSDYHFMYTNWSQIPMEGYSLLPKYFWLWNNKFQMQINKWSTQTNYHQTFVGGNLFLSQINTLFNDKEVSSFYDKNKIHIFISLQLKKLYSEELTKAINSFENQNVVWHFKTHPFYDKVFFEEYIEQNFQTLPNKEYKFSSATAFYELLNYIDINITYSSSTALELKAFSGVPTIYTRKMGLIEEKIEKGYYYCQNSQEIIDTLNNLIPQIASIKEKNLKEKFILIQENSIKNAFKQVFNEYKNEQNH